MSDYTLLNAGDLAGFQLRQKQKSAAHQARVNSAMALYLDVRDGKAPYWQLQEAIQPTSPQALVAIESNYPGVIREGMTVSDFPLLTGDILDRMLLARFREKPGAWRSFCKVVNNLRDFRSVRRLTADGLEGNWDETPEGAEVKFGSLSEGGYSYAPKKYGRGAHMSFEMIMNDDLGAFEDVPDRLGRGGRRTIARFATGLYVDVNGPHASLYTAGNGNIVTGNPAFSVPALGTAINQMMGRVDADGEPIEIEGVVLSYPPALHVTVQNVLNQLTVEVVEAGGSANQRVTVGNWIVRNLRAVMDPFIPLVASTANGATSWFVFADPNDGRPALEIGFLTGFNEPVLYQKLANTRRVGGDIDQAAGDFMTMSQEYKGVVAFGGSRMDPRATIASNGSGVA